MSETKTKKSADELAKEFWNTPLRGGISAEEAGVLSPESLKKAEDTLDILRCESDVKAILKRIASDEKKATSPEEEVVA